MLTISEMMSLFNVSARFSEFQGKIFAVHLFSRSPFRYVELRVDRHTEKAEIHYRDENFKTNLTWDMPLLVAIEEFHMAVENLLQYLVTKRLSLSIINYGSDFLKKAENRQQFWDWLSRGILLFIQSYPGHLHLQGAAWANAVEAAKGLNIEEEEMLALYYRIQSNLRVAKQLL